jgi:hypothetical protein
MASPGSRLVPTHAALVVGDEEEAGGLDGLYDKYSLQKIVLLERGRAFLNRDNFLKRLLFPVAG